jgi:hypothetical protein
LSVTAVEVEDVALHRDVPADPDDAGDVEPHESCLGGIVLCEDRDECRAVSIETNQDNSLRMLVIF